MSAQMKPYGCHNRAPFAQLVTIGREVVLVQGEIVERPVQIANFSAADSSCHYTLSDLGRADARCLGCVWRQE